MTEPAYRFCFEARVPVTEAIESLYLAVFASEGIHGRAQVRLDVGYAVDPAQRTLVVAGGSEVGRTVARIFTALLARQFGEGAFSVEQVSEAYSPAGRA